ncbi:MAG: PD-(D/E)XK nuclease family protein, partial [Candidatus Margulisiibacteriota bacterium]
RALTNFAPVELERKFEFQLDDKIKLKGIIDRIDVWNNYALLIDYKTGSKKFKIKDLESGEALQLPIYALAIEQESKYQLSGMELYLLKDSERKGLYIENEGKAGLLYLSGKRPAIYNSGQFKELLQRTRERISIAAQGIVNGKIAREPFDLDCSDKHCAYANVCRVDKWALAGLRRREGGKAP